MASLAGVVAHGGVAGLIAESFVAIAVAGVFLAIWLRERSARRDRTVARFTDDDETA